MNRGIKKMECLSDVWVDQFNQIGLPVALLALMFYAMYRVAGWLAPKVDSWVNNYLAIQEQKSKTLQEASDRCLLNQTLTIEALNQLSARVQSLQQGN